MSQDVSSLQETSPHQSQSPQPRSLPLQPSLPVIRFYGWTTKRDRQYFYLSNFYYSPFVDLSGRTWGTSEAYFQAQKYAYSTLSLTSEQLDARKQFVESIRVNFTDCPALAFRLCRSHTRGGLGQMLAFLGINQPLQPYASKSEKQQQQSEYVDVATRLRRQYRSTPATLGPISPIWCSQPLNPGGRIYAMIEAIVFKFYWSANLRQRLLDTGRAVLFETNPRDYFWAIGKLKTGQNVLGRLLMMLRDVITRRPQPQASPAVWIERLVFAAKSAGFDRYGDSSAL